jgi:hypothetical protein
MATSRRGFFAIIRPSHDPSAAPLRAAHRTTAMAPMISRRRTSRCPIFDVRPSLGFPPVGAGQLGRVESCSAYNQVMRRRPEKKQIVASQMLLRCNGWKLQGTFLVALLRAYFDESYGPDGHICVAGYVFTKSRADAFDKEWRREVLERYCLPYFRMSACAHGTEPFDGLLKAQRIDALKRAISVIHKYALHGVAVTVDPTIWSRVTTTHPVGRLKGTPYAFCAWNCILMIAIWAQENRGGNHSISYIFESGDAHQKEANALMHFGFGLEHNSKYCMYGGHGFLPKERATPCQAADLFAWQWFTDSKRRASGKYSRPREDLVALIEGGVAHNTVHADEGFLDRTLRNLAEEYAADPRLFSSSSRRPA